MKTRDAQAQDKAELVYHLSIVHHHHLHQRHRFIVLIMDAILLTETAMNHRYIGIGVVEKHDLEIGRLAVAMLFLSCLDVDDIYI